MITRHWPITALLLMSMLAVGVSARTVETAEGGESTAAAEDAQEQTKDTSVSEREFSPEVEKLLTETSDQQAYGEMERCIQTRNIRTTRILDDQHIVFEMPRKKYFLVQFKHRCHRLRRDSTLVYETRSSQLCRLDQIQATNNFGLRDIGPPCSIPGFIEVTGEQVSLLEESLKAKRKASQAPPATPPAESAPAADPAGR